MILNASNLPQHLSHGADFTTPQHSYSPVYSNIGLDAAAGTLYAHYNRKTAYVFDPLLPCDSTLPVPSAPLEKMILPTAKGCAQVSFYDVDAFLLSWQDDAPFTLPAAKAGEHLLDVWTEEACDKQVILRGQFALQDARDPDRSCPFAFGVRMLKGSLRAEADHTLTLISDENGQLLAACAFQCLEDLMDTVHAKLAAAPDQLETACEVSRQWLLDCIGGYTCQVNNDAELTAVSTALRTLLFNLAKAPGLLKVGISAYPNRGTYPTHYLWDSCFQNLAFEKMNTDLAADSLRILAATTRCDGKTPQFVCSTWIRPEHSQPSLIAWAARRLEQIPGYEHIGEELLPALERNCQWWLEYRGTRWGLIALESGLECGWDDSPRYDKEPILALDMNSYLLNQMKYVAELHARLGSADAAAKWQTKAEAFAQRMVDIMYDPEQNIFYDVFVSSGVRTGLMTPASFLPLWAGVNLPEGKAEAMIRDYLLNPAYMFGPVPFPSVAYHEETYEAPKWWRGPTWMPVSRLMLETLSMYGFNAEAAEAQERLFNVVVKDGKISELFNSQTGEGLGAPEQGWTGGIFLRWISERA